MSTQFSATVDRQGLDDTIQRLLELERLRQRSLVGKDFSTLSALLADDIVYTHSTGVVQDKSKYLDHARNALTFLSIDRGHLTVRVLDNVAMMSGAMTNIITAPSLEKPMEVRAQVLQVWVQENGSWKMAAFQATRTPEER